MRGKQSQLHASLLSVLHNPELHASLGEDAASLNPMHILQQSCGMRAAVVELKRQDKSTPVGVGSGRLWMDQRRPGP